VPQSPSRRLATEQYVSDGLAQKVNSSTYTAGLAAKQDAATLGADVVADPTARAAYRLGRDTLNGGGRGIVFLGDSITANGATFTAIPSIQQFPGLEYGWVSWATATAGGRWYPVGIGATGGYTPAQIRDTHLPTVLARKPAYCVTLVGQNSQTDLTAPVDIWQQLVAAGITPILCTLPATGTSVALWKFNQFVVRYAGAHGLPLVDFHAATVDATTGGYKTGYSDDGTHPTEVGAKAMGQALADVLAEIIRTPATAGVLADTNAATDLLVGNPLMLTDDGGGLATNWTGLAAFDGSFSTDPAVAGRLWTVAAPTTADAAVGAQFDVTAGHRYQIAAKLSADVEAVGGGWVLRFLSVVPTVNFYTLAEFTKDAPVGSAYSIEWTCPATITSVRFDVLAKTAAGASMSIGQFTVRDLTALGLA
jgi:lysophospholipase L1-like esterase